MKMGVFIGVRPSHTIINSTSISAVVQFVESIII
jgi:hypothetical protein